MQTKPKETIQSISISVVIPAYNSERSLHPLVRRLETVLLGLTSKFELILVNDDSSDQTWKAIKELAAQHDWIREASFDIMQ